MRGEMKIKYGALDKSDMRQIRRDLYRIEKRRNLYAGTLEALKTALQADPSADNFYPWSDLLSRHLKSSALLEEDVSRAAADVRSVKRGERARLGEADQFEFFGKEEREKIDKSVEALRDILPKMIEGKEVLLRRAIKTEKDLKTETDLYSSVRACRARIGLLERLAGQEMFLLQDLRSVNSKLAEWGWLCLGFGGLVDVAYDEARSYLAGGQHQLLTAMASVEREVELAEISEELGACEREIEKFTASMAELCALAAAGQNTLRSCLESYRQAGERLVHALLETSASVKEALSSRVQLAVNERTEYEKIDLDGLIKSASTVPRRVWAEKYLAEEFRKRLTSNQTADAAWKADVELRIRAFDAVRALYAPTPTAPNSVGRIESAWKIGLDVEKQLETAFDSVKQLDPEAASALVKEIWEEEGKSVQETSHALGNVIEDEVTRPT